MRLLVMLAVIAGLALVGGKALPALSVDAARADACNYAGEWPNCATQCAVTGENCDAASDGDVDYGWICATTGNDCDSGTATTDPDVYATFWDDGNQALVEAGGDAFETWDWSAWSAASTTGTEGTSSAGCKTVGTVNWAKTITRNLIYQVSVLVHFCWGGGQVTSFEPRTPTLDSCCLWLWHFDGWDASSQWGDSWSRTYRVQAKFQACVAWCYKETHPWMTVTVRGDGSWTSDRGL